MPTLSVPAFAPTKIPPARTHLIVGKRNTGKSTLLADLCFYRRKMAYGIAMAGSAGASQSISEFMPATFVHDRFDAAILARFWAEVKRMNGKLRRRNKPMVDTFLILDDTGHDKGMLHNPTLMEILMNGRQYNLSLYLCLQYAKDIRPAMRSQVDYLYIMREKSLEMQKKLWDCFAGGLFADRTQFRDILDACTADYRCLILQTCELDTSLPFSGAVSYHRAKFNRRKFTIGCDQMWVLHTRTFNEHYASDEEEAQTMSAYAPPKTNVTLTKRIHRPRQRARAGRH